MPEQTPGHKLQCQFNTDFYLRRLINVVHNCLKKRLKSWQKAAIATIKFNSRNSPGLTLRLGSQGDTEALSPVQAVAPRGCRRRQVSSLSPQPPLCPLSADRCGLWGQRRWHPTNCPLPNQICLYTSLSYGLYSL